MITRGTPVDLSISGNHHITISPSGSDQLSWKTHLYIPHFNIHLDPLGSFHGHRPIPVIIIRILDRDFPFSINHPAIRGYWGYPHDELETPIATAEDPEDPGSMHLWREALELPGGRKRDILKVESPGVFPW